MTSSVPAPRGDFEPGVARELTELTQALKAEGGRQAPLQTVCELAVRVVDADHASVTVRRGDGLRAIATTPGLPEPIQQVPCPSDGAAFLDPAPEQSSFVTGDLSRERSWPEIAARAERAGVHSLLSSRLLVREDQVRFLNVFAHRRAAFTESDVATFGVFAAHAAVVLQAAEEQERADNLEIALRNSRRIGTAIGILMHGRRIDEESAFELLRRHSQHTNRKLAAVADDVVRTGVL